MEPVFAIVFGVMVAVAAYLLMSRNVLRMVLGLLLLGNAANLSIFVAGRMGSSLPPLVTDGQVTIAASANPLPQALILTAIVISFGLQSFAIVLLKRVYALMNTDDLDDLNTPEEEDI